MSKQSVGVSLREETLEHLMQLESQLADLRTNRSEIIDALLAPYFEDHVEWTGEIDAEREETIRDLIRRYRTDD